MDTLIVKFNGNVTTNLLNCAVKKNHRYKKTKEKQKKNMKLLLMLQVTKYHPGKIYKIRIKPFHKQ